MTQVYNDIVPQSELDRYGSSGFLPKHSCGADTNTPTPGMHSRRPSEMPNELIPRKRRRLFEVPRRSSRPGGTSIRLSTSVEHPTIRPLDAQSGQNVTFIGAGINTDPVWPVDPL